MNLDKLVARLRSRDQPRTEATLQADIRQLLLLGRIGLDETKLEDVNLETPIGDRRRIDIEVGTCVIEVKKSLEAARGLEAAVRQLEGYLVERLDHTGLRYVGILTDGLLWVCYHVRSGSAEEVTRLIVPPDAEGRDVLLAWLEGVLATARNIPPTPRNIRAKLGATSSAYQLDRRTLAGLFRDHASTPTVVAKRTLWARLLTTALGTSFDDDDDLFIEHTLLVLSAEVIAHAILGFDPAHVPPDRLITGVLFEEAGVHGVVEADFFDWVIEVEGGPAWVRTLARRLTRFVWDDAEHDVLKTLYESVIKPETRRRLGEYYTPDWLAERIVHEVQVRPLEQRLLDPACGSGTFLFHAVRRYLTAAEAESRSVSDALAGVTEHVIGLDLHPVAVTLARVTYLLAMGRDRLTGGKRGAIRIPVYLGDSLQWQYSPPNLWNAGNLSVRTDAEPNLFDSELLFPEALLESPMLFDELVDELTRAATERPKHSEEPPIAGMFDRLGVAREDRATLRETFQKLRHLSNAGRDHIWSYYVRNLARPTWFSQSDNRVDCLVGNPPWLAYRNMTAEMQRAFRSMSQDRGLWQGAEVATHQDLSALFIARTIELYLRPDGIFGMVVPNAALDRAQFEGFRTGVFGDPGAGHVTVAFELPWDLRRLRPHFFPRGAAVVFGSRTADSVAMPALVQAWEGRVSDEYETWDAVSGTIVREPRELYRAGSIASSDYRQRFNQGASLNPRCLFFVEPADEAPLGVPSGQVRVRSSRSANEKPPWKHVRDRAGVVEARFVRRVIAGQVMVPYRIYSDLQVVVPVEGKTILTDGSGELLQYPRLATWWKDVQSVWEQHRSSDRLSLSEQMDYRSKLSKQLAASGARVVYSKSGMHMVAARIEDDAVLINDSLYWATVESSDEAIFLCAILNSNALTMAVRPLMSYGKDERHFDKYVWEVGIPDYLAADPIHQEIVSLGKEQEEFVAALELSPDTYFVTARTRVRDELQQHPNSRMLEEAVEAVLAEPA